MCRMIVLQAARQDTALELLRGFAVQSGDSRVGAVPEAHGDGWGLASAGPDGVRIVARSPRPLCDDPEFLEAARSAWDRPPRFLLAHARQASRGAVRVENCHPFLREGWAFMHNGTVDSDWSEVEEGCQGETDSERLFHRILRRASAMGDVGAATADVLRALPEASFTSATVVATDGSKLFAFRRIGTRQDDGETPHASRYGLFQARWRDATIWAQEPTHLPPLSGARELPMGRIVRWPDDG